MRRLRTDQGFTGAGSGDYLRPQTLGRHTTTGWHTENTNDIIDRLSLMRTQFHLSHKTSHDARRGACWCT